MWVKTAVLRRASEIRVSRAGWAESTGWLRRTTVFD